MFNDFLSISRRRVLRVSLLLIASIVLTACGGGDSSSDSSRPFKVAAIGDSFGNGFGGTGGWPGRLSASLGVPVANNSQNGRTVRGGLGVVSALIASEQPSHLVIMLGANDANSGEDLNLSVASMSEIVAIARSMDVVPIVATPIPNISIFANDRAAFLANSYRGIGGAVIADVRPSFEGRPELLLSDGLHPTAEGQQIIAEIIRGQF